MGDVEYDLGVAMFSMVNGTLMAKDGRDQVNEPPMAGHGLGTNASCRQSASLASAYFDFNVLGVKCRRFALHPQFARAAVANRICRELPRHAGFTPDAAAGIGV
jgi:hypothetical protein